MLIHLYQHLFQTSKDATPQESTTQRVGYQVINLLDPLPMVDAIYLLTTVLASVMVSGVKDANHPQESFDDVLQLLQSLLTTGMRARTTVLLQMTPGNRHVL